MNVELRYQDPRLTVTIGAGRWLDKAIVGGIGLAAIHVLPVLLVPAAIGVWKQRRLPQRTVAAIQDFLVGQPTAESATLEPPTGLRLSPRSKRSSERDEPVEPGPRTDKPSQEEEFVESKYAKRGRRQLET
jgi:hypothetical protein